MRDPRYVIARDNWADRLYVEAAFTEVCDLPDAEHVHVARHPDGTITATAMEPVSWSGRTAHELSGEWWVDALKETPA